MAASVERLRAAAATGAYYEELLQFKTIVNRKANMRKDRAAIVQLLVDGVTACIQGARAAADPAAAVDVIAPAAGDIALLLVELVFTAFKAKYDAAAAADIEAVAVALAPLHVAAWGDAAVPATVAKAAVSFLERAQRWARDKATVREAMPPADATKLNWLHGVAAAANGERAVAIRLLTNVTQLPPAAETARRGRSRFQQLAAAVVADAGGDARAAGWYVCRAALMVMCHAAPDVAEPRAAAVAAGRELVRACNDALRAAATPQQLSPPLNFFNALAAALAVGDAVAADAVVDYYASECGVEATDAKLVALARHVQHAHQCTKRPAETGGGGGLLSALLNMTH